MTYGKLYLIPTPLGDGAPETVLPAPVFSLLPTLHRFVVEETRTARRFLSSAGLKGHIGELEFHELNEHTAPSEVEKFLHLFEDGTSVGLLSEAGLPAVADPGALLVALCHRHGIEVVPLVGPSSLMMALMAQRPVVCLRGLHPGQNGRAPHRLKGLGKAFRSRPSESNPH